MPSRRGGLAVVSRLRLTLACGDYDRTRALHDGSIVPDGLDLVCLRLPVEDINLVMSLLLIPAICRTHSECNPEPGPSTRSRIVNRSTIDYRVNTP
jgi:hypothetical protein